MEKLRQMHIGVVACNTIKMGREHDCYCITHHAYLLDCLGCGVLFHTSRPHTRYHDNACRQKAYRARRKARREAYNS